MKKEKRHNKIILTPEAMALREIRKEKGHTIKFVAEKIGRSESYLRHIETGRRDFPRRRVLMNILDVYSVTYKVFRHKVVAIRNEKFDLSLREQIKLKVEQVPKEKLTLLENIITEMI